MKKKRWVLVIVTISVFGLVGCGNEVAQTVEVTQVVQETVIVTRVHEVVITATPKSPYTPALQTCQPDNCVPYFAGSEVIQQYFTLIDQGAYEEAYQLLSQAGQNRQSLEDYIIGVESYYQVVKIITIEPYYASDPNTEIQYYVEYYHESDRPTDRNIYYYFITVIFEDDTWKLDAFDTMTKY